MLFSLFLITNSYMRYLIIDKGYLPFAYLDGWLCFLSAYLHFFILKCTVEFWIQPIFLKFLYLKYINYK